jgi:hypothetical protein
MNGANRGTKVTCGYTEGKKDSKYLYDFRARAVVEQRAAVHFSSSFWVSRDFDSVSTALLFFLLSPFLFLRGALLWFLSPRSVYRALFPISLEAIAVRPS